MMQQKIKTTLFFTLSMLFIGCTSFTPTAPILPDTPSFIEGKKDGCSTATGDYAKNSNAFNADEDYKKGWFYGRKNCNPAQSMS